jgi:hypothetical protein
MANVHIVIPELFLPQQLARDACTGLELHGLEKLLARAGLAASQSDSLESWLCATFGVADMGLAPWMLQAEGVQPAGAYWMCADPVHIRLQGDQMILQANVTPTPEEAAQLCASLNAHFAEDGLSFVAPHPQHWYVRLTAAPDLQTQPLSQVAGVNIQAHLPAGSDALRWHGVFNEIQMLFFTHAVNQAREERGEPTLNSVWFWGGGIARGTLLQPCARVIADGGMALALASAGGVPAVSLPEGRNVSVEGAGGDVLVVWEGLQAALQRGDLGAWRNSLQQFERACMTPLLQALKAGKIGRIILEVPDKDSARRYVLTQAALWKLWRYPRPLAYYGLV